MINTRQVSIICVATLIGSAAFLTWRVSFHHRSRSLGNEDTPVVRRGSPEKSESTPQTTSTLLTKLDRSESDPDLLKLARSLIAWSPQRALAVAQKEQNPDLRKRLLIAVARAWGEANPQEALTWATSQPVSRNLDLAEAVLTGALQKDTKAALAIAHQLLISHPDFGGTCVGSLIGQFCQDRHYAQAARLARVAPTNFNTNWLSAVYESWAQNRPQEALRALASVSNPDLHNKLFHSVVTGWAAHSPSALAAYAESLPSGHQHTTALMSALDNWSLQNPTSLAAWLKTLSPGPDYDVGVAMMLSKTDSANLSPVDAMKWAESIDDPALRLDSVAKIADQWISNDPSSARAFISELKGLDQQDKETILKQLPEASANSTTPNDNETE